MSRDALARLYRGYIDCLNARDWARLGDYVHAQVHHNGRALGLHGYRAMLEDDVARIPDLRFDIHTLLADPPRIACRLHFEVTPAGSFLGLPVDGRKVRFDEHVFYEFLEGRIRDVWSVIDKAAIEAQLR